MRVALCLSGLPREVEEGYQYLKRTLLDRYAVDVFAHAWLEDPYKNNSYQPPNTDYETRMKQALKVLELYKPKAFSLEEFHIKQDWYEAEGTDCLYGSRCCSQLESVYIANSLKRKYELQNHFKYECVIRCRYDFGLQDCLQLESYDLANHVFIMDVGGNTEKHVNDHFAFSSSERMDVWADLFNHIQETGARVIAEDPYLADIYKQRKGFPDNHDLYAKWNKMKGLNAKAVKINCVPWRIGGAKPFD